MMIYMRQAYLDMMGDYYSLKMLKQVWGGDAGEGQLMMMMMMMGAVRRQNHS